MRGHISVVQGFVLAALVLLPGCLSAQGAAPPCDEPEVVHPEGGREYNRLVCRGIAALEAGRAKDAVVLLDSAVSKLLFEYPNFQVLPRLALAYWRAGDAENAREVLELSRATLSVLTGIYRCSQGQSGFTLQTRGDSIRPGIREATMRRMCGAAYEWVYEPSTLEAAAADAEIIRLYLNAVEEIDGGS